MGRSKLSDLLEKVQISFFRVLKFWAGQYKLSYRILFSTPTSNLTALWDGFFVLIDFTLITTRNKVGARLYFYTCLWFCSQGVSISVPGRRGLHPRGSPSWGGLCPGGSLSGGSVSRGVSVQGGVCPEGVSVWEVSVQGVLCPGGGVSVRGVSVQGVSVWVGLCLGGLYQGLSVMETPPPYGNEWAVCILLECILVRNCIQKFVLTITKQGSIPVGCVPPLLWWEVWCHFLSGPMYLLRGVWYYPHYKISWLKSVKSTLWTFSQLASLFHEVLWF